MQTVRQMASGIVYAIVSLLLVIGSVALSLAQERRPQAPPITATPSAPPTYTQGTIPTAPLPATPSPAEASAVPTLSATATQTQTLPTSTYFYPSAAATARPASTSTRACGPYAGWIRVYLVQPGDTLYRIATMHGITVGMLQRANCKFSTVIYVGELLWVPFLLPPPTELTIIPTFDTPTEPAISTSTLSPSETGTGYPDP